MASRRRGCRKPPRQVQGGPLLWLLVGLDNRTHLYLGCHGILCLQTLSGHALGDHDAGQKVVAKHQ
jgi:hypothetical protein